jgi:hypothetical protein
MARFSNSITSSTNPRTLGFSGHIQIPPDPNFTFWQAATKPGSELDRLDPKIVFFYHAGFAISRWALVDRILFQIFCAITNLNKEKAAHLFYRSPYINTHFAITDNLITIDKENVKAWPAIAKLFNDNIGLRNRLAHDPVSVIVSAAGGVPEDQPLSVPPPQWQFNVEPDRLLQKQPKDTEPVTIERIVKHIEEVTKLHLAVEEFLNDLPKKEGA